MRGGSLSEEGSSVREASLERHGVVARRHPDGGHEAGDGLGLAA